MCPFDAMEPLTEEEMVRISAPRFEEPPAIPAASMDRNDLPAELWLQALKDVTPVPALWGGNYNVFNAGREML
jgi:hypothetical protein